MHQYLILVQRICRYFCMYIPNLLDPKGTSGTTKCIEIASQFPTGQISRYLKRNIAHFYITTHFDWYFAISSDYDFWS